ncbi:MAG: NAD(P)/FAD-dependent oxidoreductase, partial [Planctomycetaceae bacterium]
MAMRTTSTPATRPQPAVDDAFDVAVVGAGPAGTTVAALVAEAGVKTLLLERAGFPRFHVGESLVPETYWTLKRLGLVERLKQTAFPKKFSVQFVTETGKETAPFYFDEHKPCESSQTWQVIRGEFDQMLLENAVDKGATARTDAAVREVLFDGDRAVGVRAQLSTEPTESAVREIAAKVVVDATGQSAFLATRLGLKQADVRLTKGSVWTYFRGAARDAGKDEGATIILQTEGKKSWFWYIPLRDDVVSVGCTGSMSLMFAGGATPEQIFNRERDRCGAIQRRLASAERCTDFFTTKDFSYKASQAAGPGWVLVGDAFGFIDPVYSTGVFLALKSGEFAADAICDALRHGDPSAERLGGWQHSYNEGVELFRKLVYAFYTPGFSFGDFLRKHPQYRDNLVDILIGDVFKPRVGEIFDAMGEVLPP